MSGRPTAVSGAEAVARIAQLAGDRPGETIFVGIDGLGGAGKSTLARQAAEAAEAAAQQVAVVPIDDFWGHSVREWDWDRFNAEVGAPLAAGRAARYRAWDWAADELGPWREVSPHQLVIVEGVSATRREVVVPWILTVWVDVPEALRLERIRERDGRAQLSRWIDDWLPSEQAYVEREQPRERVDLIVAGWQ